MPCRTAGCGCKMGISIADHAVADGKDVEHDVHAVSHQGFGGHKADEIVQCRFGAFEFVKVHRILEQRYGEEQHDQRIAYADHGAVKTLHHAPYSPALKRLGAGCHQPPKLCQFAIPCGKRIVQIFDNPVLIQNFTYFRIKEMTALLKSRTVMIS